MPSRLEDDYGRADKEKAMIITELLKKANRRQSEIKAVVGDTKNDGHVSNIFTTLYTPIGRLKELEWIIGELEKIEGGEDDGD